MSKILIIGTAWPYRGGLAVYNERLAKAFADEGHQVRIETFVVQYPGFLFPGKSQYSDAPYAGAVPVRRSVNSVNPLNWIRVGRRLRREGYDLAVIKFWLPLMGPCLGTLARILRRGGTRVVSVLDNVVPHEKRPGDRLFTRWFVRNVDGFVAMSDSVHRDLSLFDTRKPRALCPHPLYDNFGPVRGRDESLARLGLPADRRYALFFGLIRDYKGLDLLLEAFADRRLESLGATLIVAGEFYSDSQRYYDIIERRGLQGRVRVFPDFVPDDEVGYYFGAADIVAQPYKSATQSGVTQIAYHFGKPMLVTDVGGLGEIVPHGKVGYVVPVDAAAIADALADFFGAGRGDDLARGVAQEKRKYEWGRMTRAILDISQQQPNP